MSTEILGVAQYGAIGVVCSVCGFQKNTFPPFCADVQPFCLGDVKYVYGYILELKPLDVAQPG